MEVSKRIVIQLFLGYLVAHVPIMLAVSYWSSGGSLAWSVINSVGIVVIALSFQTRRIDTVTKIGVILVLTCVFGLAIQSLFLTGVEKEDLLFIAKMVSCVGLYTIANAAAERYGLKLSHLSSAVVLGCVLCLASMIISVQFALDTSVLDTDISYAGGIFGVSSSVALFSGYLSGITVINAISRPHTASKVAWHIIGVVAVLVTLRRTAWVSLCAQYLSIAVTSSSFKFPAKLVVVWLLIGSLAWYLAPGIPAQLYDGISIRAMGLTGESIGSGRSEIYRLAAAYLMDCDPIGCWAGVGSGQLKEWMARDFGLSIGSHSLFLDIGIRFGWPALVLSTLFFLSLAKTILWAEPSLSRSAGLISLSHIFVFAMFSGLAFDVAMWPGFIFLGLVNKR